jgi:hypothetical protein
MNLIQFGLQHVTAAEYLQRLHIQLFLSWRCPKHRCIDSFHPGCITLAIILTMFDIVARCLRWRAKMCLGGHCFLDSGGARGASPYGRGKVFVCPIFQLYCADFLWRANKISHSYQPRMSGYAPLVSH